MRIWDVPPGYLNRGNLLGEHRELHAVYAVIFHGKKGYSRHPETQRWRGCIGGLIRRHQALVAEMTLRGYRHKSFLLDPDRAPVFPRGFIDPPHRQYALIREKCQAAGRGRIPIPETADQMWRQHRFSVSARDETVFQTIERGFQRQPREKDLRFAPLAETLVHLLRRSPTRNGLLRALGDMEAEAGILPGNSEPADRLRRLQTAAVAETIDSILETTAISELSIWTAPSG